MAGVSFHKPTTKWQAYAEDQGKRTYLGLYMTEHEAISAVDKFNKEHSLGRSENIIDDLEYKDGELIWKRSFARRIKGNVAGYKCKKRGYIYIRNGRSNFLAHRLIWEMIDGPIPEGMQIDHKNGNRSDNRIENLRLVTQQQNLKNTRLRSNNTSGFPGITALRSGRFRARIGNKGSTIYLGEFLTKDEAINARKDAEKNLGYYENHGRV